MTKHRLVAKLSREEFENDIALLESDGWQAMPSTFELRGTFWSLLMFKVESNSPYRTEASS